MCDVQAKLIPWLDCELSPDEAADVDRHIRGCQECRGRLGTYKQVSETIDVYCDAVVAAKTPRGSSPWVAVLASAVVAAAVMFLIVPRRRVEPPPVLTPTSAVTSASAISAPLPAPHPAEAAPRKMIRRRHAIPTLPERAVNWRPSDTAVQIAIPADAMFPPGAMPQGMNFIAELSVAPDGSVQQVRLRE